MNQSKSKIEIIINDELCNEEVFQELMAIPKTGQVWFISDFNVKDDKDDKCNDEHTDGAVT